MELGQIAWGVHRSASGASYNAGIWEVGEEKEAGCSPGTGPALPVLTHSRVELHGVKESRREPGLPCHNNKGIFIK